MDIQSLTDLGLEQLLEEIKVEQKRRLSYKIIKNRYFSYRINSLMKCLEVSISGNSNWWSINTTIEQLTIVENFLNLMDDIGDMTVQNIWVNNSLNMICNFTDTTKCTILMISNNDIKLQSVHYVKFVLDVGSIANPDINKIFVSAFSKFKQSVNLLIDINQHPNKYLSQLNQS